MSLQNGFRGSLYVLDLCYYVYQSWVFFHLKQQRKTVSYFCTGCTFAVFTIQFITAAVTEFWEELILFWGSVKELFDVLTQFEQNNVFKKHLRKGFHLRCFSV